MSVLCRIYYYLDDIVINKSMTIIYIIIYEGNQFIILGFVIKNIDTILQICNIFIFY